MTHPARLFLRGVTRALESRWVHRTAYSANAVALDAELLTSTAVTACALNRVSSSCWSMGVAPRRSAHPTRGMRIEGGSVVRGKPDASMTFQAALLGVAGHAKAPIGGGLASMATAEAGSVESG